MERVKKALHALPGYFDSAISIEGIQATDRFSLNTMLGAAIELQVVETLNRIRGVWDPDGEWPGYRFERQSQTFPDCLLRKSGDDGGDVALGVELKGWHVLSKEAAPSFGYSVTPGACTKWDLLAVIPWHLSNVLAGTPRVGSPGLWSAQYAAAYRNWWWQHGPESDLDTTIDSPSGVEPYQRRSNTCEEPRADDGGNFGRIARVGIMSEWIEDTLEQPLAGIPARRWIDFLLDDTTQTSDDNSAAER